MDLDRVVIDKDAKIHFKLAEKAPKFSDDLFIVSEDGELTKNLILERETAWTDYLFGGRGGIYVYTYKTPKGETLKKVYDGTMFKTEVSALIYRIEQFKSKIEDLTHDINTLCNTMCLDADRLAELVSPNDNGES